ncbi:DUF3800 domain-containing protein [Bradyrhizobium sp. CSA207]|uniref:DUF3800 domain-containing protein n=1 Tax=Bradyrhizobium sp. CSA207 TaxID=2698826 RepID=UPI0023B06711|nr:DUF3800 domain-containing protein [Bradyrhizobium sp. CSA207]MDE5446607.1 DUF3800 domain-containing protein [Bradyrhizobium sp. CSA207]
MRYIYLDEAGTSAKEPVSVVVGVIIHADHQYVVAEDRLREVFQSVPEQFREGFIFHAKSIWSDRAYRNVWSFEDRLNFLKEVMAIPRKIGIPIALGIVRRDSSVPAGVQSKEKFQHVMAFFYCIGRADKYIRDHAHRSEVATVVAEDVDGVKEHLRAMVKLLKDPEFSASMTLSQDQVHLTAEERWRGVYLQEHVNKVERIRDTVHFVSKQDGPLLQLADACAFAFRRYFSEQKHGDEFVRAVLGTDLIKEDWTGPASGGLFFGHLRRYEPKCRFLPVWRVQVA